MIGLFGPGFQNIRYIYVLINSHAISQRYKFYENQSLGKSNSLLLNSGLGISEKERNTIIVKSSSIPVHLSSKSLMHIMFQDILHLPI